MTYIDFLYFSFTQYRKYKCIENSQNRWSGKITNLLVKVFGAWVYSSLFHIRDLRIDYCDEHVIQEISYISGAILLIHNYYISFEAHYFSTFNYTSRNEIAHKLLEQ